MVEYSGYVATPSNLAHGLGQGPRLEIRLVDEAHYGGTLINTDPQFFDLPASGAYSVDLIPSDQLRTRSGRPALYHVAESWVDAAGGVHSQSDWGLFYLRSSGGTLSDNAEIPAGVPGLIVVATPADLPSGSPRGTYALVMSTGEIREMR